MRNCKEYLERQEDGTYSLVLRGDLCKDDDIEVPEGAEIAIQFKNDPDKHGVVFYKNGGKSCMGENDDNWEHGSGWTMDQLLNENYHEGECDLSHNILWQREQDEPFLTPETTLNDQYAEIEEVRQQTIESTLSQRQTQYGCYEDVAQVTQQILSALRIGNYDKLPAPMKESLHMIASKMARIVNGDFNHLDSWHDIGGYAKLIEKLIKVV